MGLDSTPALKQLKKLIAGSQSSSSLASRALVPRVASLDFSQALQPGRCGSVEVPAAAAGAQRRQKPWLRTTNMRGARRRRGTRVGTAVDPAARCAGCLGGSPARARSRGGTGDRRAWRTRIKCWALHGHRRRAHQRCRVLQESGTFAWHGNCGGSERKTPGLAHIAPTPCWPRALGDSTCDSLLEAARSCSATREDRQRLREDTTLALQCLEGLTLQYHKPGKLSKGTSAWRGAHYTCWRIKRHWAC